MSGYLKKIRTKPDKWTLVTMFKGRYSKLRNIELDLTDKAIAQKVVKDEDINHRLHHGSAAPGVEELELYAYMFTEFFQVIEVEDKQKIKKLLKYYYKYKALRDAISHRQLDPKNPNAAMQKINMYYTGRHKFEFTSRHEFNFNSEKNMKQLKSEANKLKKRAMSYLEKRM